MHGQVLTTHVSSKTRTSNDNLVFDGVRRCAAIEGQGREVQQVRFDVDVHCACVLHGNIW